ncbi:MAG: signal peptidase I [Alicyclobacillus sp.]|nr:signal peptidase I [Alicyclobacillus sp.]
MDANVTFVVAARKPLRWLREWVLPIAVGIALAEIITHWVLVFSRVPSGSMYPTIPVDPHPPAGHQAAPSYMIVDKLAAEFGQPYRGEVIVFKFPDDPTQDFVKRIIGLPGDTVSIHGGHVYVNGKVLHEPYLTKPWGITDGTYGPYHVPKNSYFVLGDNRDDSDDSRLWIHTYVPRSYIIGRADLVVWPLNHIHWLGP